MTRKLLVIAAFGLLYTIGTPLVGVLTLGAAMSGFEPGQQVASPATIRFYDLLSQVLMQPLIPLFAPQGAPGLWGYAFIFANGVIWGAAFVVLWSAATGLRRLRRAASAGPPNEEL